MKAKLTIFAIILFGVTSTFARADELSGIQWTLVYANGRQVTNSNAYFEIARNGDRFTGNTGCNRMFGVVDVKGQRIDFGNIGTTKMMCKLPAGSVSETAFVNALEKANKFAVNGNTLYVFDQRNRTILRFKRLVKLPPVIDPPARGSELDDKKWVLESIKNRKTFVPIKGVFLNFDARKNSVGGNSGCNVFGGSYSENGAKLAIKDVVSTMRACVEDGRMNVEREFFDGLRTANRFEMKDGRLFLYKGREILLTLRGEAKN